MTNLEAQEPDSEIAADIRARLQELAGLSDPDFRHLLAALNFEASYTRANAS